MIPLLLAIAITTGPTVSPDPNPGCPWVSYEWYSPCAISPPVPGITPGWLPIDGVPGTYGPHGYTPVRG